MQWTPSSGHYTAAEVSLSAWPRARCLQLPAAALPSLINSSRSDRWTIVHWVSNTNEDCLWHALGDTENSENLENSENHGTFRTFSKPFTNFSRLLSEKSISSDFGQLTGNCPRIKSHRSRVMDQEHSQSSRCAMESSVWMNVAVYSSPFLDFRRIFTVERFYATT